MKWGYFVSPGTEADRGVDRSRASQRDETLRFVFRQLVHKFLKFVGTQSLSSPVPNVKHSLGTASQGILAHSEVDLVSSVLRPMQQDVDF